MVLTFRQRVGFMQSRVSARFAGRSPVECSHFVFTATSRRPYSLLCRSDRSCLPHTSYLGRRCLILAVLLGEDTGLGSDPPVIRACHSFFELDDL